MSNKPVTHTPEPWQVAETGADDEGCPEIVIRGMDGRAAICVGLDFGKNNPLMQEANARRIVACVNAFEGVDIEAFEGKTVAEFVANQTMLTGAGPSERGGFGIQLEGGACHLLAHAFGEQFKGSGAVNFLEVNFVHDELGDMSVTMQRTSGKTPGQLKAEAVAQRDELLAAIKKIKDSLVLANEGSAIVSFDWELEVIRKAIAKAENFS